MNLTINYLPYQEVLFNHPARVKIIPKGRRVGFTHGLANYCIDSMFSDREYKILWVDTIASNIERYFERYFMLSLRNVPSNMWRYKIFQKTLYLYKSILDFRSADKPENIEGFAYDLIIINEAGIVLKDEYLWNNTILPMTLDYKANMIVGGTPKGKRNKKLKKDHLFYELFNKAKSKEYTDWQDFTFTSYDNPLLSKTDIDELYQEIPVNLRDQEVKGKFVSDTDQNIFNIEWFKEYEELPIRFDFIIDSWDTAFKKNEENDYSAKITFGILNNLIYIIDYYKDRLEYPELKRQVATHYTKFHIDNILIEDKASGISIIQDLTRNTNLPIQPIKVDRDKIARAHAVTPLCESGKILIPKSAKWKNEFLNSLNDFPNGEHDDDVDAFTQGVEFLKSYRPVTSDNILTPERQSITDNY